MVKPHALPFAVRFVMDISQDVELDDVPSMNSPFSQYEDFVAKEYKKTLGTGPGGSEFIDEDADDSPKNAGADIWLDALKHGVFESPFPAVSVSNDPPRDRLRKLLKTRTSVTEEYFQEVFGLFFQLMQMEQTEFQDAGLANMDYVNLFAILRSFEDNDAIESKDWARCMLAWYAGYRTLDRHHLSGGQIRGLVKSIGLATGNAKLAQKSSKTLCER